jgi:hypothetical protein
MDNSAIIELTPEAVSAIRSIGDITGRKDVLQVLSDALRTYEWILREQASDKRLIAMDGQPEDETELTNFVMDKQAAKSYFMANTRADVNE